jgi:multidrug efflux pump
MGIVIFTGLSIGTLFTLFVVPAMYYFLAADHHRHQEDSANGHTNDVSSQPV